MSSGGLWLLDAVLVLAGAAAAAYVALQLGLARTAVGALAGLCLAVGIVASVIAASAGALRVEETAVVGTTAAGTTAAGTAAAAPPHQIAMDAARFARLRASAIPGRGHVDAVAGSSVIRYDESRRVIVAGASRDLVLRGWAIVGGTNLPGSAVFAVVDGEFAARATYGQDRPDVAQALGAAACAPSGFTLTLHGPAIGAGRHRLVLGIATPDGTGYETLGAPIALELRGPSGA